MKLKGFGNSAALNIKFKLVLPLQGLGVPLGFAIDVVFLDTEYYIFLNSVLGRCARREREEVHSDLDLNLLSVNKSLNGNQETVFLVAFVIIKEEAISLTLTNSQSLNYKSADKSLQRCFLFLKMIFL